MNLDQLSVNRFLTKGNQVSNVEGAAAMALNSSPITGGNFYDSQNFDTKDARQIQTGTVISNCFIRTTDLPARIELSGNDMKVYDDSTGGSSPVTGDSASINFIRSDDPSKFFSITKRASINDDLDNVMDFYYSPPANGKYNYIFFGRSGDLSDPQRNTGSIYFNVNIKDGQAFSAGNGIWAVSVTTNEVVGTTEYGILTGDSRNIVGPTFSGFSTIINADDGGVSGIAYSNAVGLYMMSSSEVTLGLSLIPDADMVYDIGSATNQINLIYAVGIIAFNVGTTNINTGSFVNTVKSTFNGSVVACPLPTVDNALEVIRKIPEPTRVGNRGHYGDKLYFDDQTFPMEVLWEIDGVPEIEHTHMIGLLMKAVVELTKEVDYLKTQLIK